MIKTKFKVLLLVVVFFSLQVAFAWQGSPGNGPPSPPGDGDNGALVKDVEEVSLETPWFLFFLFLLLWYFFPKINKLITK